MASTLFLDQFNKGQDLAVGQQQFQANQRQNLFNNQQAVLQAEALEQERQAVQARAVQEQRNKKLTSIDAQRKAMLELGFRDEAIDLAAQGYMEMTGQKIDPEKWKKADKDKTLDIMKTINGIIKVDKRDDLPDEAKKVAIGAALDKLEKAGAIDEQSIQAGDMVSGDRPELATEQTQQQAQQGTPEEQWDNISNQLSQLSRLNVKGRPEEAQVEQLKKNLEAERALLGKQIGKVEPERKTLKDATGRHRFIDTGEAVFPDVEKAVKAANKKTLKDAEGRHRYLDTGELVFPNVETPKDKGKGLTPTTVGKLQDRLTTQMNTLAELEADPNTPPEKIENLQKMMRFTEAALSKETTYKPTSQPLTKGQSFILPSGDNVLSFDGGRTFRNAQGQDEALPFGATKLPGGATLTELRNIQIKTQAGKQLSSKEATTHIDVGLDEAGRNGTGPYANFQAFTDAVFGGLGFDAILGKNGFFQDTQSNRQALRVTRQIGKEALLNSARGATWEQRNVDKLFPNPDTIFTNPTTEAKKIKPLRDVMTAEKEANLKALASGNLDNTRIQKVLDSNRKIDQLLELLGEPPTSQEQSGGFTEEERSLIERNLPKGQ